MGHLSKYAAAFTVGALLSGGAAYAIAASGGSTITVCVSKRGGTLYKAKKCAKRDAKLTWNRQGPPGAAGQNGAPGTPGSPGAPGTARAYAEVSAGATPTFKSGRVKGFTAVSSPSNGFYCLTPAAGVDPTTSVALLTPMWDSGFANQPEFAFRWDENAANKCSSNQFTVLTESSTGPSGAIDFSIVVP